MPEWRWRIIVIVNSAAKQKADSIASDVDKTHTVLSSAFVTPLTNGTGITHWGTYVSATDDMVSALAEELPSVPGAMFWRHDASGALVASNITDATNQPWGWPQSLEAAGLAMAIQPTP